MCNAARAVVLLLIRLPAERGMVTNRGLHQYACTGAIAPFGAVILSRIFLSHSSRRKRDHCLG